MKIKNNFKSKHDFNWAEYWVHHAIPLSEAMELLSYSRSTVVRKIKLNRIHGFKCKGNWFVILPQIRDRN